MKTSNSPVPETLAEESPVRSNWKLQVLPFDASGNSKVRRVVTSVVLPSLKTLPLGVWKRTAPVQTSYWEMALGRMIFVTLGPVDGPLFVVQLHGGEGVGDGVQEVVGDADAE